VATPTQSLAYRVKRALTGVWPRWGGSGVPGTSGWTTILPGARFDYATEAGDTWSNATLALGLAWLHDRFPRPIQQVSKIDRSGRYKPLPRHPLVDLWARPNPYDTRRSLEGGVGLSLKCDGNGYVLKVRSGASRVVELWWLPHFWVEPAWPSDGSAFISHYVVTVDGKPARVEAEDIIHFRVGKDPRNVRKGLAATKACLRSVCTDNEADGYVAGILRNSAVPALAVVPDADNLKPSKDDAERIKGKIADTYGGEGRGGTVVFAGRYKIQPVGFSPEQLALDKLPQGAMAKLGASVGVPLMAMGLPDPGKTYSNVQQAIRTGWGAVRGVQDVIAEGLRWSLMADMGTDPYSHTVEYDYGQIDELQEDQKIRSDRVCNEWKLGLRQLNEARDELGLEPDPDGDRYYPGTGAEGDEPDPLALPMDLPPGRQMPEPDPAVNGNGKAHRWGY
jgi:phage portal protein BeeE